MATDAPHLADPSLREELFLDFFYLLRAQEIPVSTREWLMFVECLDKGLAAADLYRFYALARCTLIKSEQHYDLFDRCFAHYFSGAEPPAGFSKAFDEWLKSPIPSLDLTEEERALLDTHSPEELRKMFEERLKEQNERHDGGNKWIGTGGTSPFGHGGQNPQGIRMGGEGGGRQAIQVAMKRRFQAYRSDLVLDVRQLGLALRKLRRLGREGVAEEVDIDATIDATARNAGDITVALRPPRENRLKVLLLMDVGGSMDPFALLSSRMFSAAHQASHFKEFHAFYFHNCIYESVFRDARMSDPFSTDELMRWLQPETRVIVVGDAFMAPYELLSQHGAIEYWHDNEVPGIRWLERLTQHFTKTAWLNPMSERYWKHPTISAIAELFPMFEMTLDGLDDAVTALA